MVSGIQEKHFRVSAMDFEIDRGAEEKPRNVIITRHKGNLAEAQVADFQARLVALVEDAEGPEPG
jgi:hypothetical protein